LLIAAKKNKEEREKKAMAHTQSNLSSWIRKVQNTELGGATAINNAIAAEGDRATTPAEVIAIVRNTEMLVQDHNVGKH